MRDTEQRAAAKAFAEYWKERGYEKGESQPFWLSLLRDVLGVEAPEKFITFEEQVRLDHTSFIDGFIKPPYLIKSVVKIVLFLGGLIFNYLNEKCKNIYPSWLVHMCANFATNTIGFILFGIF